ncbi:unnamed protein product [Darwinula stevensoni]|uniref:Uncharacterized protein n=1 Tax=Darwinula stevensoni TaxID=69355 RepID=A0A7R8XGW3_9CRUS|nr:unnamed protein product [Darwinula stevensoni]CAG0889849.1 unnamed protein product [Darwinula stevensoni]
MGPVVNRTVPIPMDDIKKHLFGKEDTNTATDRNDRFETGQQTAIVVMSVVGGIMLFGFGLLWWRIRRHRLRNSVKVSQTLEVRLLLVNFFVCIDARSTSPLFSS